MTTYGQVPKSEAITALRKASQNGQVSRLNSRTSAPELVPLAEAERDVEEATSIMWPLPEDGGPGLVVWCINWKDGDLDHTSLQISYYPDALPPEGNPFPYMRSHSGWWPPADLGAQPPLAGGAGWCAPSP